MDGLKLSDENEAFLTRLFGPRIPDECAGLFSEAKGVHFIGSEHIEPALSMLVSDIIHRGLGYGTCAGWRVYEDDGATVVSVYRLPASARAA